MSIFLVKITIITSKIIIIIIKFNFLKKMLETKAKKIGTNKMWIQNKENLIFIYKNFQHRSILSKINQTNYSKFKKLIIIILK